MIHDALTLLAPLTAQTASDGNAGFFAVGGIFLVFILLALASLALIIWAIVDLVGNPRIDGSIKIVWAIVIFFIPLIGSIVYLVVGRKASEQGSTGGGRGFDVQ